MGLFVSISAGLFETSVIASRAGCTEAEKFERVAQIAEPILPGNPLFRITNRAGDVDQNDTPAGSADQVVVMFAGITDLIVTARALKVHLVNEVKFFHQQNHSENRGIIRTTACVL